VEEEAGDGTLAHANDSTEVLRRWGCTDNDIAEIFAHGPSWPRSDINQLQNNLHLLQGLGITSPDLGSSSVRSTTSTIGLSFS
ncbi:hypothetical protein Csa_003221, partial [Cucumis sativus]